MKAHERERFWDERARELLGWSAPWSAACPASFDAPGGWFAGASLDVSANCLDRHIAAGREDVPALIWQGEPEQDARVFTYAELAASVGRAALALAGMGVSKGCVVGLCLPSCPELVVSMLALAKLGAVHLALPAGLAPPVAAERLRACKAQLFIAADGYYKAGRAVPISHPEGGPRRLLVKRTGHPLGEKRADDAWWADAVESGPLLPALPGAVHASADPLFILYTSGSSGPAKAVVHAAGGFLAACAYSARQALGIGPGMTVWCEAEPGWIMGHAYAVFAPLCLGATTLLYEGSPGYPRPDRIWRICQKHQVGVLVTTPALVGQLMREGEAWPAGRDLPALKLVVSVGEKLTPESREWLVRSVGKGRAPVLDAWGQTETGGILMISGSQGPLVPLPGVETAISPEGRLMLHAPWPGMAAGFVDGPLGARASYDTGDLAAMAPDGKVTIQGRAGLTGADLPLAQVEACVAAHPGVAEAAAVASGEQVLIWATLRAEAAEIPDMEALLAAKIRSEVQVPGLAFSLRLVEELPKTRSGKIARQALRCAAEGCAGDVSGLADPSVLAGLMDNKESLF